MRPGCDVGAVFLYPVDVTTLPKIWHKVFLLGAKSLHEVRLIKFENLNVGLTHAMTFGVVCVCGYSGHKKARELLGSRAG